VLGDIFSKLQEYDQDVLCKFKFGDAKIIATCECGMKVERISSRPCYCIHDKKLQFIFFHHRLTHIFLVKVTFRLPSSVLCSGNESAANATALKSNDTSKQSG